MRLTFETPLQRLIASAFLSAGLMALMVEGWSALSRVEESLVTDWWEAPWLAQQSAQDTARPLP